MQCNLFKVFKSNDRFKKNAVLYLMYLRKSQIMGPSMVEIIPDIYDVRMGNLTPGDGSW